MLEQLYSGVVDPKEMTTIIKRLHKKELYLVNIFEKIQVEIQKSYSDTLRGEYLNIQAELMLLRENIGKAKARLKELKRL